MEQETPTIQTYPDFDADADAAVLRKAMKGFGTDEAAIIRVLAKRTSVQRQTIGVAYQQAYGKMLISSLRSELSGDVERLVLAMMTPPAELLADHLHRAMSGLGTDEQTLIEILCTSSNQDIESIKTAYQTKYQRPLGIDLQGDTSGHFRRLLVSMSTGARDVLNCDVEMAPQLAQQLYMAGEACVGTEESEFNKILTMYSYPLLKAVFEEYRKIEVPVEVSILLPHPNFDNPAADAAILHEAMTNGDIRWAIVIKVLARRTYAQRLRIKSDFNRAYGRSLLLSLGRGLCPNFKRLAFAMMRSPAELLSNHLYQSDYETLAEIICTRSRADIVAIDAFYLANFNRELSKDLRGDTPNYLTRLLVTISRTPRDMFTTDLHRAHELAQQLHKACEGRTNSDQLDFGIILSSYSYLLLGAIFEEYKKIKGKSLQDTIKSEFPEDIRIGLLAVVRCIENRPRFLAKRLHDAMHGSINGEHTLIRMIVTKSEVDLGCILQATEREYGRLSEKDFMVDIPRDYKKVLLALLREAN